MKLGKRKLAGILEKETGIPKQDIIVYGKYDFYGNKERLELGSHTIVAINDEVMVMEPVYEGEEVTYRSRTVRGWKE